MRMVPLTKGEWDMVDIIWPITGLVYTSMPPKYSPQFRVLRKDYIAPDFYYIIINENESIHGTHTYWKV